MRVVKTVNTLKIENKTKPLPWIALAILIASLLLLVPETHAKPLSLMGNWQADFRGSDQDRRDDGLVSTTQRYTLQWRPAITEKMSMAVDFAYSNQWLEGSGTRRLWQPGIRFDVGNDIFALDLNLYGGQRTTDNSTDSKNLNWAASLTSTWDYPLWPSLFFNMGQRWSESESSRSLSTTYEYLYSFLTSGFQWSGYHLDTFYQYSLSRSEYISKDSYEDSESHFAKVGYANSFLNNRVNFSFSQLYNHISRQLEFDGSRSDSEITLTRAFAANDFTPESGALPQNGALVDRNYDASAFTITFQQPANLAIRTDFREVDRVFVYTTKDPNYQIIDMNAVRWDLYTSNDGVNWQRAKTDLSAGFNDNEYRFEVRTGKVQTVFMKLFVKGWPTGNDINITEIEAYTTVTSAPGSNNETKSTNYNTNLYLGIVPLTDTRLSYSFGWDRNEFSPDANDSDRYTNNIRLSWQGSRLFTPSFSISNNMYQDTLTDNESRSYSLNIASVPIRTVDFSLGLSRNEFYEFNEQQTLQHSISLKSRATLYPDLTTELNLGYSKNENKEIGQEFNSQYIQWLIRSRLRKGLTLDLDTYYSTATYDYGLVLNNNPGIHSVNPFQVSDRASGYTRLQTNWRLSELLSMTLNGRLEYGDQEGHSVVFNTRYLVFRTSKTHVTANYSFNTVHTETGLFSETNNTNTFNVNWVWDISRFFTFNTNLNYYITENNNSWSIVTFLTARF